MSIPNRLRRFVQRVRPQYVLRSNADRERGDVPGWVMITIMTAAIVIAILAVARPQLRDIFTDAINSVTNSSTDNGGSAGGGGGGGN